MTRHSTLVLHRRKGDKVLVNEGRNEVEIEVTKIQDNGSVTLVFRGPTHVKIDRSERRLIEE